MGKYKVHVESHILLNGELFVLVKEASPSNNNPCLHCDLRFRCKSSDGRSELRGVCIPANRDGSFYFVRSSHYYANKVIEALKDVEKAIELITTKQNQ